MKTESHTVFMVYGSFEEPEKRQNFIIARIPYDLQNKPARCPWTKKIVPALNRLVRPWFGKNRGESAYWNVDGDNAGPGERSLWNSRVTVRYDWDGEKFTKVQDEA